MPTEYHKTIKFKSIFTAKDVEVPLEFKNVKNSKQFPKKGLYVTTPQKNKCLNFLQFLFERGPSSHHMYQPAVNNRPIDFASYTSDSGVNRALCKVFLNENETEDIGSKNVTINMFSVTDSAEEGGINLYSVGELIGDTVKAQKASFASRFAKQTSYEDFHHLCGLFNFNVSETQFNENPLNCLHHLCMKFSSLDLKTVAGLTAFLGSYDLVEKLDLKKSGLEKLTSDNLYEAIREIGFAIRRKTNVRCSIVDGQHRGNFLANMLNGIFDLGNKVILDLNKGFADNIDTENTGIPWAGMSFHDTLMSVTFANAGICSQNGSRELLDLNEDVLDLYFSFGIGTNAAQNKNIDVPLYKQPIQEAVNIYLKSTSVPFPLVEVLKEPEKYVRHFKEIQKKTIAGILERWKTLKNDVSLIDNSKTGKLSKKIDTVRKGYQKIAGGARLFSHGSTSCGGAMNGDMFCLISLCQLDDLALRQLKKLFVLPQPVMDQRKFRRLDQKLFFTGEWISAVIVNNLKRIYKMIQRRLIFEAVLLYAMEAVRSKEGPYGLDLKTCFDNGEWVFNVGYFQSVPHWGQHLERHFGVGSKGKSITGSTVGLGNTKFTSLDGLLARIITSYFFSDLVDAIHEYGYNFKYPTWSTQNESESEGQDSDVESEAQGSASSGSESDGETMPEPVTAMEVPETVPAEPAVPETVPAEPAVAGVEDLADVASSDDDLMTSFLKNPSLKSIYNTTKGWKAKHTLETFIFCWSHWVCEKLECRNVPRRFIIMRGFGAFTSSSIKDFGINSRTHTYLNPMEDLSAFAHLRLTVFLRRACENGGFSNLLKEGMGAAGGYLKTGIYGEPSGGTGDISTIGDKSATGGATAGVSSLPKHTYKSGEAGEAHGVASGGAKAKATAVLPEQEKTKKRPREDSVAPAAARNDDSAKRLTTAANRAFNDACYHKKKRTILADNCAELVAYMCSKGLIKSVTFSKDCVESLNRLHANKQDVPGELRNFFWQAQKDVLESGKERILDIRKDNNTLIGLRRKAERSSKRVKISEHQERKPSEEEEDSSSSSDDGSSTEEEDSDDESAKKKKKKNTSKSNKKKGDDDRKDNDDGEDSDNGEDGNGTDGDGADPDNSTANDGGGEGAEGQDAEDETGGAEGAEDAGNTEEQGDEEETSEADDCAGVFVSSTDSEAGYMPNQSSSETDSPMTIRFPTNFGRYGCGKFGRVPDDQEDEESHHQSGHSTPVSFEQQVSDLLQQEQTGMEYFYPESSKTFNPYHF